MTNSEYHIASFIAQGLPEDSQSIATFIAAQKGGEVHVIGDNGKVVFTIEGDSQKAIDKRLAPIHMNEKVQALSPVYHEYIPE